MDGVIIAARRGRIASVKDVRRSASRCITTAVAGAAALALVIMSAPSATAATPEPRPDQWYFHSWAIQDGVWSKTTGAGVTVGLIDTGVNASLSDLKGVVIRGIDARDGSAGGLRDIDGKKGGHGTSMAALIAGQGVRSGLVGIAPDAKILSIINGAADEEIATAIRYAADHGAKVINMSFGRASLPPELCPEPIQRAVAYAVQRNVVLVGAAGNNGSTRGDSYPDACAGVLTVGAVDGAGQIWPSSEAHEYVSLAAPGWDVPVLTRYGTVENQTSTSGAAALTSGAVALMRSAYPRMQGREIVRRLIGTALDVGPKGRDDRSGYGAIRIRRALTQNVPANTPNPPYERLDRWLANNPRPAPTISIYQPDQQKESNVMVPGKLVGIGLAVLLSAGGITAALLTYAARRPNVSGEGSRKSLQ